MDAFALLVVPCVGMDGVLLLHASLRELGMPRLPRFLVARVLCELVYECCRFMSLFADACPSPCSCWDGLPSNRCICVHIGASALVVYTLVFGSAAAGCSWALGLRRV